MLDKNFIIRKIKLIQEDLSHLEEFSGYSFDEVVKDYRVMAMVERFLEKIITRAIDINQHIIAEVGKGIEKIREYEDTFLALSELHVYSEEFAREIAPSAGLRNRLVHEYNDSDQKIIYQSMGDTLKQYTRYCRYVLDFVSAVNPGT